MSAYILLEIEVHDPEAYRAYAARTPELVARFGGRFLVRGDAEALEGAPPRRIVLVEFPDEAAARALWESPEYRELARIRHAAARSRALLLRSPPAATASPGPDGCGCGSRR